MAIHIERDVIPYISLKANENDFPLKKFKYKIYLCGPSYLSLSQSLSIM